MKQQIDLSTASPIELTELILPESNLHLKKKNRRIGRKEDASEWHIHNEYIHYGYRTKHDFLDLTVSCFEYHNETINIWTHIIGALIFGGLLFYTVFLYNPLEAQKNKLFKEITEMKLEKYELSPVLIQLSKVLKSFATNTFTDIIHHIQTSGIYSAGYCDMSCTKKTLDIIERYLPPDLDLSLLSNFDYQLIGGVLSTVSLYF